MCIRDSVSLHTYIDTYIATAHIGSSTYIHRYSKFATIYVTLVFGARSGLPRIANLHFMVIQVEVLKKKCLNKLTIHILYVLMELEEQNRL